MKKIFLVLGVFVALLFISCGNKKNMPKATADMTQAVDLSKDSTRYGIACEGCTDSVIYFLPSNNGDPVRYDILDARVNHKVFGHPRVGDNIALLVNPNDTTEAMFVVDLDELQTTWCYQVVPKWRDFGRMSKKMRARMLQHMPDSIRQSFFVPREYGFSLNTHNSAMPVGLARHANSLEDESPVVYPELPHYRQWHLLNGKLILSRAIMPKTMSNKEKEVKMRFKNDTTDIVFMGPDSLVLKFKDHLQSYYKRSKTTE